MFETWDDLDYWSSGEWQVVQERLDDMEKGHESFNPSRELLFSAMDACPFVNCRAAILGQDPYPDHNLATGIAFDVGNFNGTLPNTLSAIFNEYEADLKLPRPKTGNLSQWCSSGVFLWNVIPTCAEGKSLSHESWTEWEYLTQEIIQRLGDKGIVFAFLGGRARDYAPMVRDLPNCRVIETSHPSPRASRTGKNPFIGSRLFSTINAKLVELKKEPIDWRL